ncbi:MAG TPA: folylpolyglutamate synthase/dihydrofolate synthase family protein [Acidimicrobiales bacterium]|nr:folylpolyglutamate synthase/dihydrofolate synthase family protein [Acidimicrobiales bacterium]
MDYPEAITWLESHVNLEAVLAGRHSAPSLARMRELVALMGDPQHSYPVIHITGTNGKGSTARLVTALLRASNLSVGTYTSPDLHRVNERLSWNGEPISDDEFADVLSALRQLEGLMAAVPSRFDLLTAAAFRWFADNAVDVAVVEVGLGGLWDATNVADAAVAVITNVELDHQELLGPTRAHIAREKAGIVKPASTLVLGETDPELAAIFDDTPAGRIVRRGTDFAVTENRLAVGGRLIDLRTPWSERRDVFLALHGAHQADNAVCALTAVEAFFDRAVGDAPLAEAFATVRSPGRMEVVGRHPLVVLDGAHNPAGARAAAAALADFDVAGGLVLVVGMLAGRDPSEMLELLGAGAAKAVVATRAPSPRSLAPEEVAAAASALGAGTVVVVDDPGRAVSRGTELASDDDIVLVTGSLYVVGAARSVLVADRP